MAITPLTFCAFVWATHRHRFICSAVLSGTHYQSHVGYGGLLCLDGEFLSLLLDTNTSWWEGLKCLVLWKTCVFTQQNKLHCPLRKPQPWALTHGEGQERTIRGAAAAWDSTFWICPYIVILECVQSIHTLEAWSQICLCSCQLLPLSLSGQRYGNEWYEEGRIALIDWHAG